MTNLFQIMDDSCGGLLPVVQFIRRGVFPVIQIGIPILLILIFFFFSPIPPSNLSS